MDYVGRFLDFKNGTQGNGTCAFKRGKPPSLQISVPTHLAADSDPLLLTNEAVPVYGVLKYRRGRSKTDMGTGSTSLPHNYSGDSGSNRDHPLTPTLGCIKDGPTFLK